MNKYSKPRRSLGLSMALALATIGMLPAAAAQPMDVLERKPPDLDRLRKAEEKRQRKAARLARR